MTASFDSTSLQRLRQNLANPEVAKVRSARDSVLSRYSGIFNSSHATRITAEEYLSFLRFENNQHWTNLGRTGGKAAENMSALRTALSILLDEQQPLSDRLTKATAMVKGWGKGIATAILTVAYPEKYGVWNGTSEAGMKILKVWPRLEGLATVGEQYERVNAVLTSLARQLGVDLWTVDSLWWPIVQDEPSPLGSLGDKLARVCSLQASYSATNTPEMQERGVIIRRDIPKLLRTILQEQDESLSSLLVEGRDGTGLKTRVPWVRVYDEQESPSATAGWYVVYLFAADGSSVVLSLNQGTTTFRDGQFVARAPDQLKTRVEGAREILNSSFSKNSRILENIELSDPGGLGEGYERGHVAGFKYAAISIPSDEVLARDLVTLLNGLSQLNKATLDDPKHGEAFLLIWNPKNFSFSVQGIVDELREGRPSAGRWSALNSAIKPGDRLYLMRVGQEPKGIVAAGRASSSPYEDAHWNGDPERSAQYVSVEWETALVPEVSSPLTLARLQEIDPAYKWTAQGSGLRIPPDTAAKLEVAWSAHVASTSLPGPKRIHESFSFEDLTSVAFMESDFLLDALELWRSRKNLVLQGPPGVGKTYLARLLSYALIGEKRDDRIYWAQFHQAYSYEDFVQGYRPNKSGGFELRDGMFLRVCRLAREVAPAPIILVIDEINRGNLSKVFGELLSLIEDDKRGVLAAELTYSSGTNGGERFTVPENLFIIGMMNTADRSLAVVDYALRRRFRFVDLHPQFGSPRFRAHLEKRGVSARLVDRIATRLSTLNADIGRDVRNLGRGFEIGHSYFCPVGEVADGPQWYKRIILHEIGPLLREYYFEEPEKAARAIDELQQDSDT